MNNNLSLSNTRDIIANSIHLIQGNVITDILDLINANSADTNAVITALLADQNFINALAASANNSYTKTESDNLYHNKTYLNNALNHLDARILNNYNSINNLYTKTEINNLLLGKQPTIGANALSISNTSLLQTSLDNLDARILANYNSINTLYTKSEIDTTFLNHYLKTEINNNIYTKTQIDNNIYNKSQSDTAFLNHYLKTEIDTNLYTKTQIDNNIYTKSQLDTTFLNHYLKTEIDTNLYTKTQIDNNFYNKSQINTTFLNHYLKTEIDTNIYTKSAIDTQFTSYYNKTYIDILIANYYDESDVDTLLNNKHGNITVTDSAGTSHTGITGISGGSVNSGVLTLPSGGGGSYDDTNVRALITANTASINTNTTAINARRTIADSYTKSATDTLLLQKHPTLTMRAAGVDYSGVTIISAPNGSVSNGVLTIPQFDATTLTTNITQNTTDIANLDLSSIDGLGNALAGKMNSGDQLQIWTGGTNYSVATHLRINGSTVTFNGSFAELTITQLTTLSNTVNDSITGLSSKVSSLQFTATTNNLDAAIVATENDILTKQDAITSSNRLNADLIHDGTISNIEFSYLNNLTGNIQSQLTNKQNEISASNRLNASLISNGTVNDLQFSYLNNATSNIQTQLNAKVDDAKESSLKYYDPSSQLNVISGTSPVYFLNTDHSVDGAGRLTFNVKPLVTDIGSGSFTSWMISQAKRGYFALDPSSFVLGYWACLHGNDYVDVVQGRRLLKYNTVTNGFPVYAKFPTPQPLEYDGWRGDGNTTHIVPGFQTQTPTQNGLGYPAGANNPFTVEFQVQKIGSNSTVWGPHMVISNEIASGAPPSDNLLVIGGYISNGSFFGWDSRSGGAGSYSVTTYTSGWSTGPWTHYAIVGTGTQYKFYINGILRATQTPTSGAYLTVLDGISITNGVSNNYSGVIREICVWSVEKYNSDFDSQYNPNLRWNGLMLT